MNGLNEKQMEEFREALWAYFKDDSVEDIEYLIDWMQKRCLKSIDYGQNEAWLDVIDAPIFLYQFLDACNIEMAEEMLRILEKKKELADEATQEHLDRLRDMRE